MRGKTDGVAPLLEACTMGDTKLVQYLVRYCRSDIEEPAGNSYKHINIQGMSPLLAAVVYNNPQVVKFLIEAGANVNTTSSPKWTPLRAAYHLGHTEILRMLLDAGADLDLATRHGYADCIPMTKKRHHLPLVNVFSKYLFQHDSHEYTLQVYTFLLYMNELSPSEFSYTGRKFLRVFKDIILEGDASKMPLLFKYVYELLKYILRETENNKQLDHYILLDLLDEMWQLKRLQPEVELDECYRYYYQIITAEKRRKDQTTILHTLCKGSFRGHHSRKEFATFVLNMHADVDAQDEKGNTALHLAARPYSRSMVNLLLERDAHIDIVNNNNQTPADIRPRLHMVLFSRQTLKCLAARVVGQHYLWDSCLELGSTYKKLIVQHSAARHHSSHKQAACVKTHF